MKMLKRSRRCKLISHNCLSWSKNFSKKKLTMRIKAKCQSVSCIPVRISKKIISNLARNLKSSSKLNLKKCLRNLKTRILSLKCSKKCYAVLKCKTKAKIMKCKGCRKRSIAWLKRAMWRKCKLTEAYNIKAITTITYISMLFTSANIKEQQPLKSRILKLMKILMGFMAMKRLKRMKSFMTTLMRGWMNNRMIMADTALEAGKTQYCLRYLRKVEIPWFTPCLRMAQAIADL